MTNTTLVILTALISGLIATIITILWQQYNNKQERKREIFMIMIAKRYDITNVENVEAMNKIDVVFYKSKVVRKAWDEFLNATNAPDSSSKADLISEKHLKLLEKIAEDIGYKGVEWDDIKHYYNPVGLYNKINEEIILRQLQIKAATAQIEGNQQASSVGQVDPNTELGAKVFVEAMKNPESFKTLMETFSKDFLNKKN